MQVSEPRVPFTRAGTVSRRSRIAGMTALCIILIVLLPLRLTTAQQRLDGAALDALQSLMRAWSPRPTSSAVVIVGIDEASERLYPQPFALWHAPIGAALSALADANARLVALDIVLPERSYEDLIPGLDAALLRGIVALKRPDRLVAGQSLDPHGRPRPLAPLFGAVLSAEALALTYVNIDADGVARHLRPSSDPAATPLIVERIAQRLGLPLRAGLVDFTLGAPFEYIPIQQVLAWAQSDPGRLRQQFGERVVLIGKVGPDEDPVRQPISMAGWAGNTPAPPGIVYIGQSVRALLAGRLLPPVSEVAIGALTVGGAALVMIAGTATVWIAACLLLGCLAAGTWWAFALGYALPPAGPMLAVLAGALARTAIEAREQRRHRLLVERQFQGYVSENLLTAIQSGEVDPGLPREIDDLGILFADLRGFTGMTEKLPAARVLDLLNRYYEAVTPAIHEYDGAIDNFRGDGILAMFGAPRAHPQGPRRALQAARAMLSCLDDLNKQLATEGLQPLRMSIGVASGAAVVGNIGTTARHCYSAIGDAVNVAARLQSKCKTYGMSIIATAAMRAHAQDVLEFNDLGELTLDGHSSVQAIGALPDTAL